MNHTDAFNRAQANHDNSLPPEDGPEPSEAHIEEAFSNLVAKTPLLLDYIDAMGQDNTTVFQLYHQYGLPRMDGSERDNTLLDSYEVILCNYLDGYREWLGPRLTEEADRVMQEAIRQGKEEAEEAAADDRWLATRGF